MSHVRCTAPQTCTRATKYGVERNYGDIGPKHATHWLNDALLMSSGRIALQVTENMELLLILNSRVIFMSDPVTSWRHVVFLTIFAVPNFVFCEQLA